MGTTDNQQKIQDNYKNIDDTDAGKLKSLIENVGIDKLNLLLNDLSKVEKISPKQTKKENKNYKNKELIFDDEDCCIYTRGDTKGGIYYFRLYDKKQQKPLFKSLKTTNRDSALNQAKSLYIDYKGKLERGESLRNIDTLELLKLHDEWNKNRIETITHKGITKDTYKVRVQFLKNWKQFIQEKNLDAALDQEKAMDQKWNLNQKKVFKLADICRKNKAFEVALKCYKYIIEVGPNSKYFLDAQLSLLTVNKELLESDPKSSKEKWEQLEIDYIESLNNLGRTSYTILLLRDLAVIQAFRLHDIEKATTTIKEALDISSASQEDLSECKLIFADILLLQNEIWDAILTFWLDFEVDQQYVDEVLKDFSSFSNNIIAKLCE